MLFRSIFDRQKLADAAKYFDLVENKKISPADALREAFGMDAAAMLKDVQNYYHSGHATLYRIPTPASLQPDLLPITKMQSIDA